MPDVIRNKQNSYFQKKNHVRLTRDDETKQHVLNSGVERAAAQGRTIEVIGSDPITTGIGFLAIGSTFEVS